VRCLDKEVSDEIGHFIFMRASTNQRKEEDGGKKQTILVIP